MARVTAVSNLKGGSAHTITVSAEVSALGRKMLLVGMDGQGT